MTPEKIGKYRVIEMLGRGGMGEVYLGEDPYIGRRVAIKMIKGADPGARDRFLHEARVIGGLTHPAIVSLIDFDFSGDEPFLVMELLTGKGLDAWIREAHTLREKFIVLQDLCEALAFAHENGVLHRDVKPSNVQVLANGRAKLMDFGIARGGAARLTATGAVMGTPEYMAPEILRDASYSAQSDVYACAVLLYEMFTGENPFAGKTVAATLTSVLTVDPPDLKSIREEIPGGVSTAVMACLRKDPAARPTDFGPLLVAVREALAAPPPILAETRAVPVMPDIAPAPKAISAGSGAGGPRGGRAWGLAAIATAGVLWLVLRPSPPPPAPARSVAGREPGAATPIPPASEPSEPTATPDSARDRPVVAAPAHAPRAVRTPPKPEASPALRALEEAPTSVGQSRSDALVVPSPEGESTPRGASAEPPPQGAPAAVSVPAPTPRPTFQAAVPVKAAIPTVSSVSPRSIRRGSSVVLEVRGDRFRADLGVKILQGRRPAVGIRVVRVEFVSPVLIRVTVLSEAELPLGGYTLLVQDAAGTPLPGLQIEVVL